MQARIHSDFGPPPQIEEVYRSECRFCLEPIEWFDASLPTIAIPTSPYFHKEEVAILATVHGPHLLDDFEFHDPPLLEDCALGICRVCGWWMIHQAYWGQTNHNMWEINYGGSGALKHLDVTDIQSPIEIVRGYLSSRYDARFDIHPRKFEEVVASVFSDFGYDAFTTAYSGDGGIDVLLSNNGPDLIGVQVKRYKNVIEVDQIRALLGSLILRGATRGIFVTTSSFQKGAVAAAKASATLGTPIELIDANAFWDLLKIAQLKSNKELDGYIEDILEMTSSLSLEFCFEMPLNSM